MKLLIDNDCNVELFLKYKEQILLLNDEMIDFTKNLLNQTNEDIARIEKIKNQLSEFIQMTDVIGFPFNMKDAELYAIDHNIQYHVIEISDE
ncbi:MAG: hypothetical protein KF908_05140 [Nitrosomonas sp.]|nr:hypothetical protein [Nitrosomonas sp.]